MNPFYVRTIIGALFIFCVINGSFSLWFYYEKRKLDAEIKALKQRQEKRILEESNVNTVPTDAPDAPEDSLSTEDLSQSSNAPEGMQYTREQPDDIGDSSDLDVGPSAVELSQVETTEDETVSRFVSPFGFGPYPALPDGWPPETWPCLSSEHELTARVEIKLISQGRQVYGAIMEDGLVYPTFKDTVYIRWETEGNHTYISDLAGDPAACERLNAIMDERRMDFTAADIPPDIKQVPFDDGGIDPYEFLDLPRR